jgi:threonine aldolase
MAAIRRVADARGLSIHLDGARLWNACAATEDAPADYARLADSVSVCLSKGLGAPVGSVIAGTRSFIDRVHRFRKMFGGGMRQAGILAAAGLYALDHHVERLVEDHDKAKRLARGLAEIKGITLNLDQVETNIFFFDIAGTGKTVAWLAEEMKKEGVLIYGFGPSFVRIVTHLDVHPEDVEAALKSFRRALA